MKTYCWTGYTATCILNLSARWRRVDSFTSRPLFPRERISCTYWIGAWVGPRACLNAVSKRKIPSPCQESNPRCPACIGFLKFLTVILFASCKLWPFSPLCFIN